MTCPCPPCKHKDRNIEYWILFSMMVGTLAFVIAILAYYKANDALRLIGKAG